MKEKKYYWIKLKTDFFDRDEIDFMLSQENGCEYIVLYQMLCMKSANNGGILGTKIDEVIIPYDINKIVRDTKYFNYDTVAVALELYKRLGLVYEEDNKILKIADYNNIVGSETKWAEKKRQQRTNNMPLKNCKRLNSEMLRLPSGNAVFVDEKRYGGNGMLAYDLANGKCEMCGSEENLCIHHNNGYSNDIKDLYILCRKCHSKIEGKGVEIVHPYVHQDIDIDIDIELDKDIDINNNKEEEIIKEEENVLNYYQQNIGQLTPNQYERLDNYIKLYGNDRIKEAINIACDKNVRTFNYFESCVKNGKYTFKNKKNEAMSPKWLKTENKEEKMSEEELKELESDFNDIFGK